MYIKNIDTKEVWQFDILEEGFRTLGIPANKLKSYRPFYVVGIYTYITAKSPTKLIIKEFEANRILNSTMKVYSKGQVILELLVRNAKKTLDKSPDIFFEDKEIFYKHERVRTSIRARPFHADFDIPYTPKADVELLLHPVRVSITRKQYKIVN